MCKHLHIISLERESLYSLLTFVKILNSKETGLYEEIVLEKLYKLAKLSSDTSVNQLSNIEVKKTSDIPEKLNISINELIQILTPLSTHE